MKPAWSSSQYIWHSSNNIENMSFRMQLSLGFTVLLERKNKKEGFSRANQALRT